MPACMILSLSMSDEQPSSTPTDKLDKWPLPLTESNGNGKVERISARPASSCWNSFARRCLSRACMARILCLEQEYPCWRTYKRTSNTLKRRQLVAKPTLRDDELQDLLKIPKGNKLSECGPDSSTGKIVTSNIKYMHKLRIQ